MVRGGQVYYDDSCRSRGGVVRGGRAAYRRLARLERCSLALLVQKYLLMHKSTELYAEAEQRTGEAGKVLTCYTGTKVLAS